MTPCHFSIGSHWFLISHIGKNIYILEYDLQDTSWHFNLQGLALKPFFLQFPLLRSDKIYESLQSFLDSSLTYWMVAEHWSEMPIPYPLHKLSTTLPYTYSHIPFLLSNLSLHKEVLRCAQNSWQFQVIEQIYNVTNTYYSSLVTLHAQASIAPYSPRVVYYFSDGFQERRGWALKMGINWEAKRNAKHLNLCAASLSEWGGMQNENKWYTGEGIWETLKTRITGPELEQEKCNRSCST